MTARCADCKYIDTSRPRPGVTKEVTGMCRYPPPVVTKSDYESPWPFCGLDDWCGKFIPKDPA